MFGIALEELAKSRADKRKRNSRRKSRSQSTAHRSPADYATLEPRELKAADVGFGFGIDFGQSGTGESCQVGVGNRVTYQQRDGNLYVYGTELKDDIKFNYHGEQVMVTGLTTNAVGQRAGSGHFFDPDDVDKIYVYARGGDDTMKDSIAGDFVVYGGSGDDWIEGSWASANTEGTYRVYGGSGDDIIAGGDGRDYIYGGSGDDSIYGYKGNDTIFGQAGDDMIFGDDGRDFLYGGYGDDTLKGWNGDDYIRGGPGDDELFGGNDDDTLVGAAGDDKLHGEDGKDLLDAGNGNNYLDGGYDGLNDQLFAGYGQNEFVHHISIFGNDDPDTFFILGDDSKMVARYHW